MKKKLNFIWKQKHLLIGKIVGVLLRNQLWIKYIKAI